MGSVMFRNNCVLLHDQDRRSSSSSKTRTKRIADAAKNAKVEVEKTVHAAKRAEIEAQAAKNETHSKEAELAAEQAKVAVLASQELLEVANRLVELVEEAAEEVEKRETAANDVSASPEMDKLTTQTSKITLQDNVRKPRLSVVAHAGAAEVSIKKAVKEAKSLQEFAELTQTATNLTLRFAELASSKRETKAAQDSKIAVQDAVETITKAVRIFVKEQAAAEAAKAAAIAAAAEMSGQQQK